MKTKTQLIILISLVVIIILFGYLAFTRQPSNSIQNPTPNTTSFFPQSIISNIVNQIEEVITTTTETVSEIVEGEKEVEIKKVSQVSPHFNLGFDFINYQGTSTIIYLSKNEDKFLLNVGNLEIKTDSLSNPQLEAVNIDAKNNILIINDKGTFKRGVLSITSSTTPEIITFSPLNLNYNKVISSPNKKQFLAIEITENGTRGDIYNSDFKSPITVFSWPLKELIISWPSLNYISLQTKPSSGLNGYLYLETINNKKQINLLKDITGLSSLVNPIGDSAIYSSSDGGDVTLAIKKNDSDNTDFLEIKTLADKCVWADKDNILCALPENIPTASYPDSWYQGLLNFNDKIWLINKNELEADILTDFTKPLADTPIDAINLKVSPDKSKLYFINKIDSTLWSLDLTSFEF